MTRPAKSESSATVRCLCYATASAVGAAAAVQGGVNTTLSGHIDSPGCGSSGATLLASLMSFAGGLILLMLLNAGQLAIQWRRGNPHGLNRPKRPWHWCGGLCGSGVMVLSLLALPVTGFALLAVARAAGQIGSSLLLDHKGCVGEVRLLTRRRALGAGLVLGGALLSVLHERQGDTGPAPAAVLYAALPMVSGCLLSLQAAANGSAAKALGHPLRATLLSFCGGVVCLGLLNAGCAASGAPALTTPPSWWAFCGGPLGVAFVTSNLVLPRHVGFAAVASFAMAGTLASSLGLDAAGAFGTAARPPSLLRVGGATLALTGAAVVRRSFWGSANRGP